MMSVTPADLRGQRFSTAFRGFDRGKVTSFLRAAAYDYEQALREGNRLRHEVARMEALLNEHREQEKGLVMSLRAAQQTADDMKANAVKEAGLIVRDARIQSDLILQQARAHAEHLQHEIDGLTLRRKDVETAIASTIQTLQNALAFGHGQDLCERANARPLHGPLLADGLASQKDDATAPDWAGALIESAPAGDSTADAADIRTRRDEETRDAVAVPEHDVRDTTVGVSDPSQARPSWLRAGAHIPDMWVTTGSADLT